MTEKRNNMNMIYTTASAEKKTPEVKLLRQIGTGIVNARSADVLIKESGLKDEDELRVAIASSWAHGCRILQVRGKYFIAKDAKEFDYYLTRQSDKDGNPVIEYR